MAKERLELIFFFWYKIGVDLNRKTLTISWNVTLFYMVDGMVF